MIVQRKHFSSVERCCLPEKENLVWLSAAIIGLFIGHATVLDFWHPYRQTTIQSILTTTLTKRFCVTRQNNNQVVKNKSTSQTSRGTREKSV